MSKLTKPQSEEGESTKVWSDARREAIRAAVLAALGSPSELLRVSVLRLWGGNFRVNVWTGGATASIPHSYFVTADEQGAILKSEPPLEKQY